MRTTPVVIQTMLHNGLIELVNDDGCYQYTKRGLRWINMLLDTPIPIPGFVDPRNSEVVSAEFRIGPGAPMTLIDDDASPS